MAIAMLPLAALACKGGEEKGGSATSAAADGSPTPDTFDYNKLTAIVLRPEDVPADLPGLAGSFNSGSDNNGISFTTWYGSESLQLQSTVGRLSDPVERDEVFDHIRRGIAALTKNERNYDLTGADLAFIYRSPEAPVTSILAFRGEFFVLVTQTSNDSARADEAYDEEALGRYTKIVFDRLEGLIADPNSVTPIAGAARYQTPTPPAVLTSTPTAAP
ncbi:MAG: hypothetical protein HY873_03380 [Chloroflexi bacterium]|nr:hypothetical protein [Chloroflexota bacterium]